MGGRLHRIDGPAVIFADGYQEWWQNGCIHRLDGPAVSTPHGDQQWWINGQLHRLDGPAVIYPDGGQEWYIHNMNVTDQVTAWMQQRGITWPWDESTQMEFVLTWV